MGAGVACLAREDDVEPTAERRGPRTPSPSPASRAGKRTVVRSDGRAPRPAAEAPAGVAPAAPAHLVPEPAHPLWCQTQPTVPIARTLMRRHRSLSRRRGIARRRDVSGDASPLAPEFEERDASGDEVVAAVEKGEDEDLPRLELDDAFFGRDGRLRVSLPSSVGRVGDRAFPPDASVTVWPGETTAPEDAPVAIAFEDGPRTTPLEEAPSSVAPEDAPVAIALEDGPRTTPLEETSSSVAPEDAPVAIALEESPRSTAVDDAHRTVALEDAPGSVAREGCLVVEVEDTSSVAEGTFEIASPASTRVEDASGEWRPVRETLAAGPPPRQAYLVDRSALNVNTDGLAYRRSKDVHDKDMERPAAWNSIVDGVEESGGWVRVGDRFLPLQVEGVTVLKLLEPQEAARVREERTQEEREQRLREAQPAAGAAGPGPRPSEACLQQQQQLEAARRERAEAEEFYAQRARALEAEVERLQRQQQQQQQLEAARRDRAEAEEFYAQRARALEAEVERLQLELHLRLDGRAAHAAGHAPVPVEPVPAPPPPPVEPMAPACPSPATPAPAARGVLSSLGRPVLAPARLALAPRALARAGPAPPPRLAAPPRLMRNSYGVAGASHGLVAPPVYVQPTKPSVVAANGGGVTNYTPLHGFAAAVESGKVRVVGQGTPLAELVGVA